MKFSTIATGNAVRRIILGRVSSLAPGDVTMVANTSVMSDEQLAHRIGAVVLDSTTTEDCTMSLCVHATSRTLVTSDDLVTVDGGGRPTQPPMPLVQLEPGGQLECRFTVVRGAGEDHARFCPVEVVPYACAGDGTVDMQVESTGQRAGRDIFAEAIDVLRGDMRDAMAFLSAARLRECCRS